MSLPPTKLSTLAALFRFATLLLVHHDTLHPPQQITALICPAECAARNEESSHSSSKNLQSNNLFAATPSSNFHLLSQDAVAEQNVENQQEAAFRLF